MLVYVFSLDCIVQQLLSQPLKPQNQKRLACRVCKEIEHCKKEPILSYENELFRHQYSVNVVASWVPWLSVRGGWVGELRHHWRRIWCHPISKPQQPRQNDRKKEVIMVKPLMRSCRYCVVSLPCYEILWIVGACVAVGHRWTGASSSSVGGRGASARSLHLSLGVVVHEARVAGEVCGRRRRHGHGDGTVVRSSGHDEGLVCEVCFECLSSWLDESTYDVNESKRWIDRWIDR